MNGILLEHGGGSDLFTAFGNGPIGVDDIDIIGSERSQFVAVSQNLVHVIEQCLPSVANFWGEDIAAQLFSHHIQSDASGFIELLFSSRVVNVITGGSEFGEKGINQRHVVNVLDHKSEAEEAVVSGLEEIFVAQQFRTGDILETGEHFLGLRVQFKVPNDNQLDFLKFVVNSDES